MLHELKIEPQYFEDILHNGKNFEIRKDDRPYEKGDYLHLKEWNEGNYTGREIQALVRYILRGGYCKEGYCIMTIELVKVNTNTDKLWDVHCYNYFESGYCEWGIRDGLDRRIAELADKEAAEKICEEHNKYFSEER